MTRIRRSQIREHYRCSACSTKAAPCMGTLLQGRTPPHSPLLRLSQSLHGVGDPVFPLLKLFQSLRVPLPIKVLRLFYYLPLPILVGIFRVRLSLPSLISTLSNSIFSIINLDSGIVSPSASILPFITTRGCRLL